MFRLTKNGFSMLEVILVIVVISISIGVAAPRMMRSINHIQLKQTVGQLSDLMRYAQSRAIIKNSFLRLEFSEDYSRYWLSVGVILKEKGIVFERIDGQLGRDKRIPTGIQIQAGKRIIQFYPDGQIDKESLSICRKDKCWVISTKEQRGRVLTYEAET